MLPDPFRLTTVPRTLKPGEPRPLPTQEARHLIEAYQRLLEELLPAQEAIEADQARQNFAQNSLFCVHLMHVFQERMAWGLLQAKQAQPPDASLDMQIPKQTDAAIHFTCRVQTSPGTSKSQSPALSATGGSSLCFATCTCGTCIMCIRVFALEVVEATCSTWTKCHSQCLLTQLDATAGQVLLQESPIVLDWTVEKEASGGDEDMLRFLQVLRVNGIEALLSPFGSRKRRAQVGCAAADKGWRRDYSVLLI
eukprot:symbB.v1.2.029760.t1/scaffold3294.1/size59574/1